MRSILWAASAAVIVMGGSMAAYAHGPGVRHYDGYRPAPVHHYWYGAPRHRYFYRAPVYGYARPVPRVRRYDYSAYPRARTCGVYHYWNGKQCADARTSPPNLK